MYNIIFYDTKFCGWAENCINEWLSKENPENAQNGKGVGKKI